MKHKKIRETEIIVAAWIILLCLACLTGATLALFTSPPEDGTIGVVAVAGDVKVDIVDATDKTTSMVGATLRFYTTSGKPNVLFEPGATFYTQGFSVKNVGDVPLNYRLTISQDENLDMDEFLRAFEIWVSTDITGGANAERLYAHTGTLAAGQCSETLYLYIKMKEDAGNEFQKKTYVGIGVTVYAVQGNASIGE